ncbi:hypothetical protein CFP56_032135 [Quercus suber]|uniref:Uncharacterized protein n=1 Tax=Quercus suber TaxID=58331 RepID=A0AAW0JJ91_QUESU
MILPFTTLKFVFVVLQNFTTSLTRAKKELLKEYEGDESNKKEVSRNDFPPNFFFGVATSAYQVLFLPSPLQSNFLVCFY